MTGETMKPAFSDALLRDAVAEALAEAAPNATLTTGGALQPMTDRHWRLAAEMGWTAAFVTEADGGLGLGLPQIADICEQMGRHLFCGPFVETAVLLPALAAEAPDIFGPLLAGVVAGEIRVALAEQESDTLLAPVEHAAGATHILSFVDKAEGGLEVHLRASSEAEIGILESMDPTITVGRARVAKPSAICVLDGEAAQRALTPVHLATAAELLGLGEASLERAVAHVGTRRQFGQPIGAFQAVKHRLADAYTALAGVRLSIAHAADKGTFNAALIARVLAADAALKAAGDAIQFHGGLGFSWEMDLHLYLKRARRLNARNGGTGRLRMAAGERFIDAVLA